MLKKWFSDRSPEPGHISHSDPLALVGSVADTKLNCAVKGATLLQLISLSADAPQWSSWDICPGSG